MKGICILNRLISRDPYRDWKRALWAFLTMQCLCILLEQVQYRNVFLKTNNSLFGIGLHKISCSLIFIPRVFCEIVWISSASEIQKCFFKPILISLGLACTKMQFFFWSIQWVQEWRIRRTISIASIAEPQLLSLRPCLDAFLCQWLPLLDPQKGAEPAITMTMARGRGS